MRCGAVRCVAPRGIATRSVRCEHSVTVHAGDSVCGSAAALPCTESALIRRTARTVLSQSQRRRCSLLRQMSHVAWSARMSACLCVEHILCKTGSADRDAAWRADSYGFNEPCIRWGQDRRNPFAYARVTSRRCGLLPNHFGHSLFLLWLLLFANWRFFIHRFRRLIR